MTKRFILVITSILFVGLLHAQKPQRIAYIDMAYILESVPDYKEAEAQLSTKANQWNEKVTKKKEELAVLKIDLSNEKALLTSGLIEEREEDIAIKTEELKKIQNKYFGTNGDLYHLRKQLVKPVQDQVYNAIQTIVKKKKFDFVFDKSSDLIMLYSNDKYDISDLVIKSITKFERKKTITQKRKDKNAANEAKKKEREKINPDRVKKAEEKAAKRLALQEKIKRQKEERLKKREAKKQALKEAKAQKIKARQEAKNKKKRPKKEQEIQPVKKEANKIVEKEIIEEKAATEEATTKETEKETKVETEAVKRKRELQERISAKKAAREKKRLARIKVIEETRKKRLEAQEKKIKDRAAKKEGLKKEKESEEKTDQE